jgi:DNA invertase Pin-like site-specific DNA recombinase
MAVQRLVGVVRVSTQEQARSDRAGLDRQVAACRAIATRENVPVEIVQVVDVSGSDLADTPEWQRILNKLTVPGTALVADSQDRLIRASAFDFRILADLQRLNVLVYLPDGIQDLRSPGGHLLSGIRALLGGAEKTEIKRRMKGGKERKRIRGEHPNSQITLPYGVNYDPETKTWSYDPIKSPLVVEAYNLLLTGGSIRQAAKLLGVTNAGARVLLHNSIYRGVRTLEFECSLTERYAKTDGRQSRAKKVRRADPLVVRVFPESEQLISDDHWHRAQAALLQRRELQPRHDASQWASGLLISAEAESPPTGNVFEMTRRSSTKHHLYGKTRKSRPPYYACRCLWGGSNLEKCGSGWLRADKVHTALDSLLSGLGKDPVYRAALQAATQQEPSQGQDGARLKAA